MEGDDESRKSAKSVHQSDMQSEWLDKIGINCIV